MKKNEQIKKSFDAFVEIETNPIEFMRERRFTLKEFGFSPRVANHWIEKGIIGDSHEAKKKIILNLTEVFWIKLVDQLRSFNVSIEGIKKIKDEFFTKPQNVFRAIEKESVIEKLKELNLIPKEFEKHFNDDQIWADLAKYQLNDFELLIQHILLERTPFFLIFDNKDEFLFVQEGSLDNNDYDFKNKLERITRKSHIRISINDVLEDIVDVFGPLACTEKLPILSKKEAEIIHLMRTENAARVEVRYNNESKPHIVEVTTKNLISERARLNEIILSRGYQDITFKTQNGQVVYCENTTKYKLDTE
jgi:hypothetical protein